MEAFNSCKKKLKVGQQKTRRLQKKVASLQGVVQSLQQSALISGDCAELLEKTFSGVPLEVMKRLMQNKANDKISREQYPPVLRSFALTLQFYSAKAYGSVRETFGLGLPHPSTIRTWYSTLDGQPGFTREVFISLEAKVKAAKETGKDVLCALMLDEMAIKKHVEWNGERMLGYVDMGTGINDDTAPLATEALVFMVVCVDSHWKVPVGYFLIKGLSGAERANLVRQCIMKLTEIGVKIVSITCDGPSCHISMLRNLGASMDPSNLDPSFLDPSDAKRRIHVLLDVCHMLKLVRNTLGSCGLICDSTGGKVRWQYIQALNNLQQQEGLRLGNKLKPVHIAWNAQKMKVNLAAQTLSRSVADAIRYCDKELQLPEFADSEATCNFIELFDKVFDVLNSRNPLALGHKAPIMPGNEASVLPFLTQASDYISSLKDSTGTLITATTRKTGFLGFLVAIKSITSLYEMYVKPPQSQLKYLLTYKFSQDHLELFFAAVRSSQGCNNNPIVRQFMSAYKRLIMRHEIKGLGGNCVPLDATSILNATVPASKKCQDFMMARRYDTLCLTQDTEDHDDLFVGDDMPEPSPLSPYKQAAVGYISGYVVRMVIKRIHCIECQTALSVPESSETEPGHVLISMKDNGGLIKPSTSVMRVCEATERCYSHYLVNDKASLLHHESTIATITNKVLGQVALSTFDDLTKHMFDSPPDNNHVFSLIKCVAWCYLKIRQHQLAKIMTDAATGKFIRKTHGKLILFANQ